MKKIVNEMLVLIILLIATVELSAQLNIQQQYKYDNLNRLASSKCQQNGYTIEILYSYDKLGNRIVKEIKGVPIITIPFTQTIYCAGTDIRVDFTAGSDISFSGINVFTAQLSDATGSFNNPVSIGSLQATGSGYINCTFPRDAEFGTKYRIRVVSSNSPAIGVDNLQDLTINPRPRPVVNGSTIVCSLSKIEYSTDDLQNIDREWQVTNGLIVGDFRSTNISVIWKDVESQQSGEVKLVLRNTITGCRDSLVRTITINPLPNPVITGNFAVCEKNYETYQSNNIDGYSKIWKVTGGTIQGDNTGNTMQVLWGDYGSGTIRLIQTNTTTGCIDSIINNITINPIPIPAITGDTIVCAETSIAYSSNSTSGINDKWYVIGGTIQGSTTSQQVVILWDSISSGSLKCVQTITATGCKDSIAKTIIINPLPAPNFNTNFIACAETEVVYESNSTTGFSDKWQVLQGGNIVGSSNNKQVSILWDSVSTGRIRLLQTNTTTGCKDSIEKTINISPLPAPDFNINFTVCAETDVMFESNSTTGTTDKWEVLTGGRINDSNTGKQVTVSWDSVNTGTIRLVQTLTATGCKDSITKTITIQPLPAPVISGGFVVCAETEAVYNSNSPTGTNDLWVVLNGGTIQGSNTAKQVRVLWDSVNSGTIRLVQTNTSTGCKDSITKAITIQPLPNPVITGDVAVCEKNYSTYSSNNLIGFSKEWKVTGGQIEGTSTGNEIFVLWDNNGQGNIKLLQTNTQTGCKDSVIQNVTINSIPNPTITGKKVVCAQSEETYISNSPIGTDNKWIVTGGKLLLNDTSMQALVLWDIDNAGSLKLIQTYRTTGCKDSVSINIKINPLPDPMLIGNLSVCANNIAHYNSGNEAGYSKVWTVSEGEILGDNKANSIDVLWGVQTQGTITVMQINDTTGCERSINQTVTIKPLPITKIAGKTIVCPNNVYVYNSEEQATRYKWHVTNGVIIGSDSASDVSVLWNNLSTGRIKLVNTGIKGCSDTALNQITIYQEPVVTFSCTKDSTCIDATQFKLEGGKPENGTYTGKSVTDNIFYPAIAGLGKHIITYTFKVDDCENSATDTIFVILKIAKPVIKDSIGVLYSSPAKSYQWYFENDTIGGAVEQYYKPIKSGLYKVEITDENGCSNISDNITDVREILNNNLNLAIVPNPFSGKTSISFNLKSSGIASISIMSLIGVEVEKLCANKYFDAGMHNIEFDAANIPSGIYLCLVDFEGLKAVRKMIIVK